MKDDGALQRAFLRVESLEDFHPGDRIWWIYLRNAAGEWLEMHEEPAIRAAFDRLKAFPENLPEENARWLDLRAAASKVLERHGSTLR